MKTKKSRIYVLISVLVALLLIIIIFKGNYRFSDYNVVLITIDTLRADHLGCYGYFRDTSPNIDSLAKDSFIFENCYSPASWTRSAIASIVSSKLPTEHGIYSEDKKERLSSGFFTIQEFFNEKDYATAAFYTNPHLNFGLVQNFGYTYSKANEAANFVYDKAINWIKDSSNNKFFLYIHNNDPHTSYDFHPGFSFAPEDSKYRFLEPFFPVIKDRSGITSENKNGIVKLN
ncbi:unnamed protein product, partial [marine sediment metagenome]